MRVKRETRSPRSRRRRCRPERPIAGPSRGMSCAALRLSIGGGVTAAPPLPARLLAPQAGNRVLSIAFATPTRERLQRYQWKFASRLAEKFSRRSRLFRRRPAGGEMSSVPWQHTAPLTRGPTARPDPLRPASAAQIAALALPPRDRETLPSSSFVADYGHMRAPRGHPLPFKVSDENGRLRVVSNFSQGFSGRGVERYANGATYVGDFANARRHGRGTYTESSGSMLVSFFEGGAPRGEGARRNADGGLVRTFAGANSARPLSAREARMVTDNLNMRPIPRAVTPPPARKVRERVKPKPPSPIDYTTEARRSFASGVSTHAIEASNPRIPTRDEFLAKLAEAEAVRVAPKDPRAALIPRVG